MTVTNVYYKYFERGGVIGADDGRGQAGNVSVCKGCAGNSGSVENYAYVIIRELNEELAKQGYRVVAGRVPTKFFKEKFYGTDGA